MKVPTSSTLPPNYSIQAKSSTSQSFYFEPWVEKACFGSQGGFKIKTFMAFSISATLGFHGGSLASSGTSALQDRATGLVPSFPEWLKVFFEDCGNENEFVDSEKTLTEVSKTSNFKETLQKSQLLWKCQLAPPCPRITLSELKALRVNPYILNIARQRSAPGSKSLLWEPGRLENHDFSHLG